MKKMILGLVLVIFLPTLAFAQGAASIDSLIIAGKAMQARALNVWTEQELMQARAYFERLLNQPEKTWLIRYYIALADYRMVSFYFGKGMKDQAKSFVEDGIEQLEAGLELQNNFAEAHSLVSALYGNKIAFKPLQAMSLGPKSGLAMTKALKLAPDNPRNYLISGWSAYFTPKMFGGGLEKARTHFQKAIALYDSFTVSELTLPDWGHAEAYAWLGLLQARQKEWDAARKNYAAALALNPDYGWVKAVLLPDLEKKSLKQ